MRGRREPADDRPNGRPASALVDERPFERPVERAPGGGPATNDFPPVLTTAMAAELLQVHVEYLRKMVREGKVPCHRFPEGREMRFLARRAPRLAARPARGRPLPRPRASRIVSPAPRSTGRGVTHTEASPHAHLHGVAVDAVQWHDGFWARRCAANRDRGIPALADRLEARGVVENFRRVAGTATGEREGLWFTDSDLYKWIEAAAWSLATDPDPALAARLDAIVDAVVAAQSADGYLSTAWDANTRYTFLSASHELYCAGHLFQAAVAHHRATGDRRLLDASARFAEHLAATFEGPDGLTETDGHPEIELALVELAARPATTTCSRSRARSSTGSTPHSSTRSGGTPCAAQYFACGLVDAFLETGDAALWETAQRLWASLVHAKSYVTGGVGGRWLGESVGRDYELPNESAYAETCGAVASVFWAWRMLQHDGDAAYTDQLERALYNGALTGMSLAGDEWSYVNPLTDAARPEHDPWMWDAISTTLIPRLPSRREPWHPVTCCPSNVTRLLASLPGYVYGCSTDDVTGEPGVWIHLYAASHAVVGPVTVEQRTDYPWRGDVEVEVVAIEPGAPMTFTLYLRIPGWCDLPGDAGGATPAVTVDGDAIGETPVPGSYVAITREWSAGDVVHVDLPMPARLVESHPRVAENRGRVAVTRGPLVYCLEAVDHPGVDVLDVALRTDRPITGEHRPDLLDAVTVLHATGLAPGLATAGPGDAALYRPLGTDARRARTEVDLTFVPYFAWANRDLGAMTVWPAVAPALSPERASPS